MRLSRALSALCLLFLAAPLAAQEGTWTRIGPEGGHISALAAAPSRPSLLYAATENGNVFKSLDRGETWAPAGRDILLSDLAVDPRTPALLHGSSSLGFLRSTDGGATWKALRRDYPPDRPNGVEVNPHNGVVFNFGVQFLFRSADRGATWRTEARWPQDVKAIAFDPVRPDVVHAAGTQGLFRSVDGGRTWQPWGQGIPAGTALSALAVDPRNPRTLWAGSTNLSVGLYKSTDGGATWKPSQKGLRRRDVGQIVVDPASSAILHVRLLSTGELFRSRDGGASWVLNGGPKAFVTDLEPVPYGLLAGTRTGVLLSPDRGLTWRDRQRGLTSLSITGLAIDTQDPPRLYADDPLHGTFKTRDRGASWLRLGEVDDPLRWERRLVVDPAVPDTVYATATSAIARSTNGGRRWENHGALTCGVATALVLDPREPSTLYASGFIFSTGCAQIQDTCLLSRSRDAGASWSCITQGLPSPYGSKVLAVDPFTSAVYVLSGNDLLQSTDHGDTWTLLAAGLGSLRAFAASPRTPGTLYAARQDGVGRSLDGGQTWSAFTPSSIGGLFISGLAIDPTDDAVVYAATLTGQGVFRSTDGGATWAPLGSWPGWSIRSGPVLDPVDPSILYVGTGEASVLRYDTDDE